MSYKLEKPYTLPERCDFIALYNHQQGLNIEETETALYALERNEIMQDGVPVINPNYEVEQAAIRKAGFEKQFFLTSLGYIRRSVNMATGEQKDFICDIVPALQAGLAQGIATPIITYELPDFTQELTTEYLESLQEIKPVTADFLQECIMQLANDFMPQGLSMTPAEEGTSDAVDVGSEEQPSDITTEEEVAEENTVAEGVNEEEAEVENTADTDA